jgi:hypothetical protein
VTMIFDLIDELRRLLEGRPFRVADGFYREGSLAVVRGLAIRRGEPGQATLEVCIEPYAFPDTIDERSAGKLHKAMLLAAGDPCAGVNAAAKNDLRWWEAPRYQPEDLDGIPLRLELPGGGSLNASTAAGGTARFANVELGAECRLSVELPRPAIIPLDLAGRRVESAPPGYLELAALTDVAPSVADFAGGELHHDLIRTDDGELLSLIFAAPAGTPAQPISLRIAITNPHIGATLWQGEITLRPGVAGEFIGEIALPAATLPAGEYRIYVLLPI